MEWKEVTLGEVSSKIGDGLHGTPKYDEEGSYYFINGNNLNCGQIIIKDDTKRVGIDEFVKNQKELNEQTILVSINGTIGNVAKYNNEPCILGKSACYINVIKEVDKEFIYYVLTSANFKRNITNEATGTTIKNVSLKQMREYKFNIPCNLADQRRIASILSSLDRKIELNNKINADLEEMAQAIFKNWFVDFEPFKDGKFVVSELGMIPEGWKVVAFDNILKVTTTKTGKEGIPEYSVTNTGIHPRDEKFTKNLSKSSAKNKLIRKGNLVFGMSREILNWGIMKEEIGGVSSAYNVYIVDEKIVSTTYLEYFIAQRMDYFADLIKPASREGQGVDKALLMKKIICIPPSEVLDVFLEKYNSIMHLTEIRNQENSCLSLLRDTLLPRLMSGELEVPE